MKCPACRNPLEEIKMHEVFVDICVKCKGIWFDSDEMKEVLEALSEGKLVPLDKISAPAAKKSSRPDAAAEGLRDCPRCAKKMHKFNYAYDSNVLLDRCADCNGIWADGGEVWMIVQFLKRIKGR